MSVLEALLSEFKKEFNVEAEVIASSPGRLDFLNTHQDYKGLPVVSVGVNLRSYVAIRKTSNTKATIVSLNMREEKLPFKDTFEIGKIGLREKGWFGNYLRAAIIALRERGYSIGGFRAAILSQVPIGGGLGSSAAFTVSFIGALNEVFKLGLSRKEIAEIAYRAEHDIMGIPCGRLDQYGSAFGGVIKIETKPPYNVEELPMREGVFVVLDSEIKHSTAEIHPRRQEDINLGLKILLKLPEVPDDVKRKLGERYDSVLWEELSEEELKPYLTKLPENSAKRIIFTIREHESTMLALKIMRNNVPKEEELVNVLGSEYAEDVEKAFRHENPKLALIGVIMNQQHALLRDLYDLSLPELEKIRNAALEAGALGVKISGAGLGGSLIALVENRSLAKRVLEAGIRGGAKRGWIVEIDDGVRRDF
mgnify:FL=1